MQGLYVVVRDAAIGQKAGYIYAIVVPRHRVLYIGQTRNAAGALARLAQHISETGSATLRERIQRHLDYEAVDLGEVHFAAFRLEDRAEFVGDSAVYREAVEALVQAALLNGLADQKIRLVILSHVERNSYMRQTFALDAATAVAADLVVWLSSLRDAGTI